MRKLKQQEFSHNPAFAGGWLSAGIDIRRIGKDLKAPTK